MTTKKEEQETEEIKNRTAIQEAEPRPKRRYAKMHAAVIKSVYSSWSCFKDIGTAGTDAAYRLRLIGTPYIMYIPGRATATWEVLWAKTDYPRKGNVYQVSFREVYFNVPPDIKKILQDNMRVLVHPDTMYTHKDGK